MEFEAQLLREGVQDERGMIALGAVKWQDDVDILAYFNGDWNLPVGKVRNIRRDGDGWILGDITVPESEYEKLYIDPKIPTTGHIYVGSAYMTLSAHTLGGTITDALLRAVYLTVDLEAYEGTDEGPGSAE